MCGNQSTKQTVPNEGQIKVTFVMYRQFLNVNIVNPIKIFDVGRLKLMLEGSVNVDIFFCKAVNEYCVYTDRLLF